MNAIPFDTAYMADIKTPSFWLTATEPFRAWLECANMFVRIPQLRAAPRGDGHTVLVLPGFATADFLTQALRNYLSFLGYDSEPWRLGFNTGYAKLGDNEELLRERLRGLYLRSGRKVSLVGWSLGGVMARHLAREHPEMVRQVITLGSPFTGNPLAITIRGLYELISGEKLLSDELVARWSRDRAAPDQVRSTAIYSRGDGITAWQNCIEEEAETTANIEVKGSHTGLTHNADVLLTIANLLSKPETDTAVS